jgi:hypothetical protein
MSRAVHGAAPGAQELRPHQEQKVVVAQPQIQREGKVRRDVAGGDPREDREVLIVVLHRQPTADQGEKQAETEKEYPLSPRRHEHLA